MFYISQVLFEGFGKEYAKTEDDINFKAVQSVRQIVGEVMKQLDPASASKSASIKDTANLVLLAWLPK
jgi:hypothetical protein